MGVVRRMIEEETRFWAEVAALGQLPEAAGLQPGELELRARGLAFLRYLSIRFEGRRAELSAHAADPASAWYAPDEKAREALLGRTDLYRSAGVRWVAPVASWRRIATLSADQNLGRAVDVAIAAIEKDNPRLLGVFPQDYGRPELARGLLDALVGGVGALGGEAPRLALAQLCTAMVQIAEGRGEITARNPVLRARTQALAASARGPLRALLERLNRDIRHLDRVLPHGPLRQG